MEVAITPPTVPIPILSTVKSAVLLPA